MNTIDWLRHAAIFVGCIGQAGFVGLWMTRRWWMHWVTKAVMAKSVTLLLLTGVSSVRIILEPPWRDVPGPTDGWEVAIVVCYWLVAAAIWLQFAALIAQVRRDALTADEIVQAEIDAARFSKS